MSSHLPFNSFFFRNRFSTRTPLTIAASWDVSFEAEELRLVLEALVELEDAPDDVADRRSDDAGLPFVERAASDAELVRELPVKVNGYGWK